jgi:hypothetical protein
LTEASLDARFRKGCEFRRVVRFNLSEGFRLHEQYYNELETKLRAEITREWSNAATMTKLGRRYALNFMRNLGLLDKLPSLADWLPPPSPMTVLGAGPSLDSFVDKGEPLICVDTALPVLAARGIRADLAVALEAQHWNLRDFIGCRAVPRALAMDMSALPATAKAVDCPVYLFWTPWTRLRFFDRLKATGLLPLELPPLGNVGITAYALARRLFSGDVQTAGLDFSFTSDQYHCRGSPGHIELLRSTNRFKSLIPAGQTLRSSTFAFVGEGGVRHRADPVMRGYRELFEGIRAGAVSDTQKKCLTPTKVSDTGGGTMSDTQKSARHQKKVSDTAQPIAIYGDALGACRPPTPDPRPRACVASVNPEVSDTTASTMIALLRSELETIRAILGGREKAPPETLAALLAQNDYLYAHFPDYAARDRPPDITDLSFLKRVSAEIEPFLRAL